MKSKFVRYRACLVVALSLLSSLQAYGAPPRALTVGEGFVDPVGFYDATPTFSWKLSEGMKKQTAYSIESTSNGKSLWNSGWVSSEQSVGVPYGGPPLASRQKVEWRVNIRNEAGKESGWSELARFELGLLSSKEWKAQWIRPEGEIDRTTEPVAWLRRTFPLSKDKKIAQARLHVTARGIFTLKLNGEAVSQDFFANGWTSYSKRLDTLTYDVTRLLQKEENTLVAMLGTGWYAGRLGWNKQKPRGSYGVEPELLLQLEITYQDGKSESVVTDGQWQGTRIGPVIASSFYDGEVYDARKEVTGWAPVKATKDLGSARITPKPLPPVRVKQTLAVKEITEPEPGRFVFDLGQNMVGIPKLKIPVEKDQTVKIRFAEMLEKNGTLYTKSYRSAKSTNTYTAAKTGTIEWQPVFTFHGFRYVELSGLPKGVKPSKDWMTGLVLYSDLAPIGSFESSHAKLNQLRSNILWGQRGNFLEIPTDCPQRDERLGWTGDAQAFGPAAMFNYDSHAFFKSWLGSMRDDQRKDGRIPHVIPNVLGSSTGSPGWMDAATIIPWDLYVRTGDREVLAENFQMMEGLVGAYRAQSVDGLIPKIKGYGDWLQPNTKEKRGDTPIQLLGTAFYARSARILADSARLLGRTDEAKRYAAEADAVRDAFVRYYFNADAKLQNAPETQTGYALAIAFDLVPKEIRSKVGDHLVRLVKEADGHLRTGFLGTPHIVTVLEQTGHADIALNMLFKETYPSWFFSINQGATTMWERWNSFSHEKGFGDAGMNSFNHYAYGAVQQWMVERLAGLAPDPAVPGYKHFFVRPLIGGPLDSARAELETPYGKASSAWTLKDKQVVMNIVVPPNTTATIEFPDGRKAETVEAGTYRYELSQK